ncbi:MAG: hypothetical protein WD844_04305 [Thermoleophilaceae bacterium]
MGRLKRLFSPALIVAVCAMVLALGGTAVADHLITGDQIARNTITGLNIENESIRGGDIMDGTITSEQLNPFTLRALLNSNTQLTPTDPRPGPQGPAGPQGDRGPTGATGANGAGGQDGVLGYEVFTSVQDFGPGGIGGAWCGAPDANATDQGWVVIGGGAKLTDADINAGVAVASSWPSPPGTNGGAPNGDPLNPGWSVQLNKPMNVNPGEVTLYAVCAKRP